MRIFIVFLFLIFSSWIFPQTPPVYDYKPAIQNIPQEIAQKLGYPDYTANIAEQNLYFRGEFMYLELRFQIILTIQR